MHCSHRFVVVSRSSQLIPALIFDGYFSSHGRPRELLENPLKERPKRASRAAATANPSLPARRQQFKVSDESVHAIRAEMPTADDDWEVEAVVEYRCVYGTEQWLVKWKGYGEERNTWEPEANLLTAKVQAEAAKVREAGLPRTAAGLQKAVVVTLKAVLAARV